MRLRTLLAGLTILLTGTTLFAQITRDVLGMHSLGPGTTSPISGARPDACVYCHAPHSGLNIGLWNQKLTTQVYSLYSSDTAQNIGAQPRLGYGSNQCLSCHDGTVAVGTTVAYGSVVTHGSMYSKDVFGSNLQTSHPFSMAAPLKDNVYLVATLASGGITADPTHMVKLKNGTVECSSCHTPHAQSRDLVSPNFLVKDGSSGSLCLACHDPLRSTSGHVNPIADWATSAHALSASKIAPEALLGSYTTVATSACISCHTPHNAAGAARLLRGENEQDCIACHNGANVSPTEAYTNVFAEYGTGKVGHPLPVPANQHDANEGVLLNNNRHATCVDCHNGHSAGIVGVFPAAPLIRVSQKDIAGVNASDGTSVLTPAVNQYENCLRCHGTSTGKLVKSIYGYFPVRALAAGDPLNLVPQFDAAATSSHPVTHTRNSPNPQPSLLSYMWNLDGVKQGRSMSTQILCTDCHNSDDNREFGGTGANGPHGSTWTHILERRYEFSQAVTPGTAVTNLFPSPDLGATGPYALCAKCHDLSGQVIANTSFTKHSNHINFGFSCSVCHTAHGMGAKSGNISGERLVNFDLNVVTANGVQPISYNRGTNTCVLACHLYNHNSDGTVTLARQGRIVGVK